MPAKKEITEMDIHYIFKSQKFTLGGLELFQIDTLAHHWPIKAG